MDFWLRRQTRDYDFGQRIRVLGEKSELSCLDDGCCWTGFGTLEGPGAELDSDWSEQDPGWAVGRNTLTKESDKI